MEKVSLFINTFNCAKVTPSIKEFRRYLGDQLPTQKCDLYVFGFQELTSILNSTNPATMQRIMTKLADELNAFLSDRYNHDFNVVRHANFGSIGLIILSDSSLNIGCSEEPVGYPVGHFYTNLKGGLKIKLSYSNLELIFICVHLNAGEKKEHLLRRNSDLKLILDNLLFRNECDHLLDGNKHCFIMGDMNYRATGAFDLSDTDLRQSALTQNHSMLDELSIQRERGDIFKEFTEPQVDFFPTYKYIVGTSEVTNKRIPSWCDRILYLKEANYNVIEYNSMQNCQISDHLPVFLHLEIHPSDMETSTRSKECHKMHNHIIDIDRKHVISSLTTLILGRGIFLTTTTRGRIYSFIILAMMYLLWKNA